MFLIFLLQLTSFSYALETDNQCNTLLREKRTFSVSYYKNNNNDYGYRQPLDHVPLYFTDRFSSGDEYQVSLDFSVTDVFDSSRLFQYQQYRAIIFVKAVSDLEASIQAARAEIFRQSGGKIEVGAVLIKFSDGKEKIGFILGQSDRINGTLIRKKLNKTVGMLPFLNWRNVREVTFMHNHPDFGKSAALNSPQDIEFEQDMAEYISKKTKGQATLRSIVFPMGRNDDLAFEMHPNKVAIYQNK
jgi:hypothetical protein